MFGIHASLAALTKCDEFSIDDDEAKRLGAAWADVLKFYKIEMTPKQEAYATLIETCATIYPPMAVALYFRWLDAKNKQPKPAPNAAPVQSAPQSARPAPPPPPPKPEPKRNPAFDAGNVFATFDPTKISIPN
ncbi:MAG: hypothetical protein KGJ13_05440 [Patescibacteria group bacterium]|nr:hypothetical protein [Patescibacteria group bacterium]